MGLQETKSKFRDAAGYLEAIPRFSKEKHSMDKLRRMLTLLQAQPDGCRVIHVAGTNGKGSVCAFLSSILHEAGFRTAVFTSPHLLSVKERFMLDGQEAGDEQFIRAFEEVRELSDTYGKEGMGHPTYFEFLFLMFMVMVRETKPEYVVLETGLGGRLDATNCLEKTAVSVITSISMDHMQYLGNTVEKIAAEKAGIIKAGVPVVYDATNPAAAGVIEARGRELGCRMIPVSKSECHAAVPGERGFSMHAPSLFSGEKEKKEWTVSVPFEAEYQAVNALLAIRAAELLELPERAVRDGIAGTVWPGRMERAGENFYLDGAHNEGGIRAFVKAAGDIMDRRRREGSRGRLILLFSVVSDKEYGEMAEILCESLQPDVLILTQLESGRGLDIGKLQKAVSGREKKSAVRIAADVAEALQMATDEKKEEDTVFCAGSLYLIGEIKKCLRRNK